MRITFFDILILIVLLGGAAWGFHRGIIRQAASTLVLYISTVISAKAYRGLSRLLSVTGQSTAATDMLSFIILMVVMNVLFSLIFNDLLSHMDSRRMPIWMNVGGMLFGFRSRSLWPYAWCSGGSSHAI